VRNTIKAEAGLLPTCAFTDFAALQFICVFPSTVSADDEHGAPLPVLTNSALSSYVGGGLVVFLVFAHLARAAL
jgi:hypothetical protein